MAGAFWLKTAVIQRALPRGLGCPGSVRRCVYVQERERESLGGSKPQSILVSRSRGAWLGLPASHPHRPDQLGEEGLPRRGSVMNLPEIYHSGNSAGQRDESPQPSCPELIPVGPMLRKPLWFLSPQESEDLERQNAALRREIKQLTEEMKHFTSMLNSHEPLCSILTSPPPPPEVLYATHSFHQPHISSPRFQH